MDELTLDQTYSRGSKGQRVKIIQEWLSLNGISAAADGDFGPATQAAVISFQQREGLTTDGIVGPNTYARLIKPMTDAVAPIAPNGRSLGEMTVAYARQHLASHPREIGGQNRGPWVRLYMDGHEGTEWAWCAGFAGYMLKQACDSLGMAPPFITSFSCDELAANAKKENLFVSEDSVTDKAGIPPGSFMLRRKTPADWDHTGIVVSANDDYLETIEGNTNDEGSREGYEVCRRFRNYTKKDFIAL